MLQDLRYAWRTLAKAPSFTVVALLALALGIGANTAIFSVVNAVLLKPLPYHDAARLVLIQERIPKIVSNFFAVCAPDVLDIGRWTRSMDSVAAFQGRSANFAAANQEPRRLTGARISANLLSTVGIAPLLGRGFTTEEDSPGHPVILLNYTLWRDRFGADPGVLGSRVLLDGQPYTIVGVMPREFVFPPRGTPHSPAEPAQYWIPMAFTREQLADVVDDFDIGVIGRMRPGVSTRQARADMTGVAHQIEAKYSDFYRNGFTLDIDATPLGEMVTGPARPILILLLGAVAFVLLIACANVANLLLTRATGRHQEMAIRAALGASRGRVLRQVLTESVLLSLGGGLLGIALAASGMKAFVAALPASIPHSLDIGLDWRVLAFASALSLLTGILFGSAPAVTMASGAVSAALNEAARGSTGGAARHRLKNVLVVAEIALSLVLLMGAGLLGRSYLHAIRTDPGFRPQQVLSFGIALPPAQYPSAGVPQFFHSLLDKLREIPGVRAAGAGNFVPLQGTTWNRTFVPQGWNAARGKTPINDFTPVSGDLLQALGVPLRRGRYFTSSDRRDSQPVAIVSENLARRYWPNQDPIGKTLRYGMGGDGRQTLTVVGVVADAKSGSIEREPDPHSYQPLEQLQDGYSNVSSLTVMVRTEGDPAALASAARRAVASLDPSLPLAQLRTMEDVVDESLAPRRFNTVLVGLFAALALFLAIIGIYGVIAFTVAQRTQEIGIRVALGAGAGDVMRLFLREGMALALAGIVIGSLAALFLGRYIATLLYGVESRDVPTLAATGAVLAATALIATVIPARRAMQLDPMLALRRG